MRTRVSSVPEARSCVARSILHVASTVASPSADVSSSSDIARAAALGSTAPASPFEPEGHGVRSDAIAASVSVDGPRSCAETAAESSRNGGAMARAHASTSDRRVAP